MSSKGSAVVGSAMERELRVLVKVKPIPNEKRSVYLRRLVTTAKKFFDEREEAGSETEWDAMPETLQAWCNDAFQALAAKKPIEEFDDMPEDGDGDDHDQGNSKPGKGEKAEADPPAKTKKGSDMPKASAPAKGKNKQVEDDEKPAKGKKGGKEKAAKKEKAPREESGKAAAVVDILCKKPKLSLEDLTAAAKAKDIKGSSAMFRGIRRGFRRTVAGLTRAGLLDSVEI